MQFHLVFHLGISVCKRQQTYVDVFWPFACSRSRNGYFFESGIHEPGVWIETFEWALAVWQCSESRTIYVESEVRSRTDPWQGIFFFVHTPPRGWAPFIWNVMTTNTTLWQPIQRYDNQYNLNETLQTSKWICSETNKHKNIVMQPNTTVPLSYSKSIYTRDL